MSWKDVRQIVDTEPLTLGPFYSGQLKGHWSLLRTMARYKFVANFIEDKTVLDIGCGEGLGTFLISKYAKHIHGIDTDKEAIDYAKTNLKRDNLEFSVENLLNTIHNNNLDRIIAIDVIEHLRRSDEEILMNKMSDTLNKDGICIIGTPNKNMSKYESKEAKTGHINMYTEKRLKTLMEKHFGNVFTFGMNDEVMYTGFKPMCQYIFAIGTNKK